MASHQERLISFLKKDVGGLNLSNSQVKDFSNQLKVLGIIDMSKTSTQEWLMSDKIGQGVLITLGTYYSLGFLSKWVEITNITTGK